MELNLEYEQDFSKKGKLSKFGGSEYGIKGPRDYKSYQLDKLRIELLKYNIPESRVYNILNEIQRMSSVEYMNMKYLAVIVNIIEDFDGLQYKEQEEFDELAKEIFNDKEFFKPYFERIIDIEKEKDSKYIRLVKTTLFTYLFKLWINRSNNFEF